MKTLLFSIWLLAVGCWLAMAQDTTHTENTPLRPPLLRGEMQQNSPLENGAGGVSIPWRYGLQTYSGYSARVVENTYTFAGVRWFLNYGILTVYGDLEMIAPQNKIAGRFTVALTLYQKSQ